jgi:hypothetical protein
MHKWLQAVWARKNTQKVGEIALGRLALRECEHTTRPASTRQQTEADDSKCEQMQNAGSEGGVGTGLPPRKFLSQD